MKINLLNDPRTYNETGLSCPNCGSSDVRLSGKQGPHGIKDYLISRTFYRCLQCGRYLYRPSIPVHRWVVGIALCLVVGGIGFFTVFDLIQDMSRNKHVEEKLAQDRYKNDTSPNRNSGLPSKPLTLDMSEFSKQSDSSDQNDVFSQNQQLEGMIDQRQKPQKKDAGRPATAGSGVDKPKAASPTSEAKEAKPEEKAASGPATAGSGIEKPKAASSASGVEEAKPEEKVASGLETAGSGIDKPKAASLAGEAKEVKPEEKVASGPEKAVPGIEKPKAAPLASEAKEVKPEEKGKKGAASQTAAAAGIESAKSAAPLKSLDKAAEKKEKPRATEPIGKMAKTEAAGAALKQGPPPINKEKLPHVLKDVKQLGAKGELMIVLVSDGPIQDYKTFFLDKPPRQVIDFAGKWQIPEQTEIDVHSDIAQRIRLGKHADKLRLVVDLTTGSLLSPVIEQSPKGLTIFLRKKS